MLQLSSVYYDKPILSLRTGGRIGMANQPIVNPNTLKIEGWYITNQLDRGEFVLPITEVRDVITKGIVVNDHTSLTAIDDMIRLRDIIEVRFELKGKIVETESGKKLGKIIDFSADSDGHIIQKLYVNPPILKGLTTDQLLIDRSAIVEITDKKIVVRDATVKTGAQAPMAVNA